MFKLKYAYQNCIGLKLPLKYTLIDLLIINGINKETSINKYCKQYS